MSEEKTTAIETEINQMPEIESLDDADMGLPDAFKLDLIAQERLSYVQDFHRASSRLETLNLSIAANDAVGNKTEVEKFKKIAEELSRGIAHDKRAVKAIDKEYPGAKARMEILAKKLSQ